MATNGIPISKIELYNLYWVEEKTFAEIGASYKRSVTTVYKWMRRYEIPSRNRREANFKLIDGVLHKKCHGPLHDSWVWLPFSAFWIRESGLPRGSCIACENVRRGHEQMVEVARIEFAVQELVRRLGKRETERRVGVSKSYITFLLEGKFKRVKRTTARRIISALNEVRQNDEVRHKDSIRYGAHLRGRAEKIPKHKSEFYRPTGDNDNAFRRQQRRERSYANSRN